MEKEKITDEEKKVSMCKQIATYSYWLTWALIVALFIIVFVLYINYYQLTVAVEKIWNATFISNLRRCP